MVIVKHLKSVSYHRLKHLIGTAGYMAGDQSFSSILRMVAGNQSNPVLTLNTLPSGGYQAVKHRIQLRSNCLDLRQLSFSTKFFVRIVCTHFYFTFYWYIFIVYIRIFLGSTNINNFISQIYETIQHIHIFTSINHGHK